MTETSQQKSRTWIQRILVAVVIVAAWEFIRPGVAELVFVAQGYCPAEKPMLAYSHLNCKEYLHFADAFDEAGIEWLPGQRGALCIDPEDIEDLLTKMAEMGAIREFPDARCPLP